MSSREPTVASAAPMSLRAEPFIEGNFEYTVTTLTIDNTIYKIEVPKTPFSKLWYRNRWMACHMDLTGEQEPVVSLRELAVVIVQTEHSEQEETHVLNVAVHKQNFLQIVNDQQMSVQGLEQWFSVPEHWLSVLVECIFEFSGSYEIGVWTRIDKFEEHVHIDIRFGDVELPFDIQIKRVMFIYQDHRLGVRCPMNAISLPPGWRPPRDSSESQDNNLLED